MAPNDETNNRATKATGSNSGDADLAQVSLVFFLVSQFHNFHCIGVFATYQTYMVRTGTARRSMAWQFRICPSCEIWECQQKAMLQIRKELSCRLHYDLLNII